MSYIAVDNGQWGTAPRRTSLQPAFHLHTKAERERERKKENKKEKERKRGRDREIERERDCSTGKQQVESQTNRPEDEKMFAVLPVLDYHIL